jgi:hypothetical protein
MSKSSDQAAITTVVERYLGGERKIMNKMFHSHTSARP